MPQHIAHSVIFHNKCAPAGIVINSWIIEEKERVTVKRQVSTKSPQHINIPLIVKIDVFYSVNIVVVWGWCTAPAVRPLPLALGGGGEGDEKGGEGGHEKG